jgi:hypothetical protein
MDTEHPLVACPACGHLHRAPARSEPHYCSIRCYRTGHSLDDPITGDGRQYCDPCRRYIETTTASHRHEGGDR